MASRIADDPRIDPRIKQMLPDWVVQSVPNVDNREVLMTMIAKAGPQRSGSGFLPDDPAAYERVAPSAGLRFETRQIISSPDGNSINLHLITPEGRGPFPCVYYIHGGGMMVASCFDANYQAWGRLIAHHGVAVAMVDFRNALRPSSVTEIAPFPAGLNDCLTGLHWVQEHATELGIDPEQIVVAGESGGANLAVGVAIKLNRAGDLRVKGIYVLCPYLAGAWPKTAGSSALENDGILMDNSSNFGAMAYGIDAYLSRDPLAWPGFATEQDVRGFPPVVIAVNECDPLRDDGIAFYRLLLHSGVSARCRQVMGTIHGTEVYVLCCPDISRDAARDIAEFCRN